MKVMVKGQPRGKSHKETRSSRKKVLRATVRRSTTECQTYWEGYITIARDSPDLYLKALKRLGLYACATYKNGSDLEMCLEAEELYAFQAFNDVSIQPQRFCSLDVQFRTLFPHSECYTHIEILCTLLFVFIFLPKAIIFLSLAFCL